ncbi:response regulator, partial [Methylobacterium sp.]
SGGRGGGDEAQRLVLTASRTFAEAVDEGLAAATADARGVALLLRPDEHALSDAERSAMLRDWLALKPAYGGATLAGGDGRVRATGDGRGIGADQSRQGWFLRAREAGAVVAAPGGGDAFALGLALPAPGAERMLLRATPAFFAEIEARVRRALDLPDAVAFTVTGADGRVLAGAGHAGSAEASRAQAAAPTRGARDLANPGWLVSAEGPAVAAPSLVPGPRALGFGLVLVLVAGGIGYGLGARAARPLARLAEEAEAGEGPPASPVEEIDRLTHSVAGRDRRSGALLASAGTGLDRIRGRLRSFESMSGWTCWEIDPETRQILWSDRDAAGASDRAGALADLAARFDPEDHPLIDLTMRAALASDEPHDVVLRTRGLGGAPPRRVLMRFLGGSDASVGGPPRVHALSRELPEDDASDPAHGLNERRRNAVLRRVTDGIVHDFNDVLTIVLANLGVLRRRPGLDAEQARLVEGAIAGGLRGAALTRRMLSLVRGAGDGPGECDLAGTLAALLPFLQANVMRGAPTIERVPAGLPRILCGERLLEVVLLNVAVHVRDLGLPGFAVGAAAHGADEPPALGLPAGSYVRLLLAGGRPPADAPPPSPGSAALETAARLLAEHDIGWQVVSDGTDGASFLAEIWLPAAPHAALPAPAPAAADARRLRILLVESDGLVRASLAEALADLGHTVVQAGSGGHALALLAENAAYDAMIADQAMPVMTGLQLAATVVERHPGIRVVLASPHGRLPASARQFLQLDKPFRPEELETLLGGLAPQARAA